jgi:hypothetical protein
MGLTRVQSARGVWTNTQNIDDLYVIATRTHCSSATRRTARW